MQWDSSLDSIAIQLEEERLRNWLSIQLLSDLFSSNGINRLCKAFVLE